MRISVKDAGSRGFNIRLPSRLLLSPTLLRFGLRMGRKHSDNVPDISLASLRELRRIILDTKKHNQDWALVEIESTDGDKVLIQL